jgi:hypothetical protein
MARRALLRAISIEEAVSRAALTRLSCGLPDSNRIAAPTRYPRPVRSAQRCLDRVRSSCFGDPRPAHLPPARSWSEMCGHQPRPCLYSTGATCKSVAMRDRTFLVDPPERSAADLALPDTSRFRSTAAEEYRCLPCLNQNVAPPTEATSPPCGVLLSPATHTEHLAPCISPGQP